MQNLSKRWFVCVPLKMRTKSPRSRKQLTRPGSCTPRRWKWPTRGWMSEKLLVLLRESRWQKVVRSHFRSSWASTDRHCIIIIMATPLLRAEWWWSMPVPKPKCIMPQILPEQYRWAEPSTPAKNPFMNWFLKPISKRRKWWRQVFRSAPVTYMPLKQSPPD